MADGAVKQQKGGRTKKALPVGVDNFEDIVRSGYYYVDKTMFIKELLDLKGLESFEYDFHTG
mgnify:CR=1 FL=1